MAVESMTLEARQRELLAKVRSARKLPFPHERRRIREQAGVSLRELAAAIGVSHVAIARWESGAQPAAPTHVIAYGRLLGELRQLPEEVAANDLPPAA